MKTIKKLGLMNYLKKHKWGCIFYAITMIIGTICETITTILIANSVAYITTGNFMEGVYTLIGCGVLAIVTRVSYHLTNYFYFKYSAIIQAEISKDLTKRSFLLSSSTFSEHNTGTFLQRIMNDPSNAVDNLSNAFNIVTTLISRIVVIFYIITLNWIIGLSYVLILIAMTLLEKLRLKTRKKGRLAIKKLNDSTYSLMGEIIKSEKDIKALDLESELYTITDKQFTEISSMNRKVNMADCRLWQSRNIILDLFTISMLILGIYLLRQDIIVISTYVLLFSYKDHLRWFVWEAGNLGQIISDVKISTSRMFSLFNEELYPIDVFGEKSLTNTKGNIKFSHVKYAYFDSKEIKDEKNKNKIKFERVKRPPIFKDLSFEIEPNTTVAFVGESGVGKSTILSLIAKLMECDRGSIKIDGINIKDLDKETLRTTISLINQSPYIFDMTIKENLKLVKDDATDDEIWDALKRASFDQDVRDMTNGIDTKVGETGIKLSGGQKQRLAIARALLKNSKIILFDESTSSLDNFAQSKIQQSIEELKGKHTIVIVAHRLSTIKNVDKIYFLQKGKISDSGSFKELYEKNETFREMFLIEKI